ncbi:ABC transporter permease DevC [Leptolyngbya sp. AN03gr2]|uniref:ABC transporter permease DevC n=1 Tax=unclassified Leptolyngbya TaxID=2650499 RepID=UPI003D317E86
MILAIPVAWLQLIHQKTRFFATLVGVTFVVVLLFVQVGFRDGLFDSAVRIHESLQGDLFMISPQYKALTAQQSFSRSRLYQSLGVKGVETVSPLYLQFGKLRNPETGQKFSIFVFGVDPGETVFKLPEINQNISRVSIADRALFDRESRREFGPISEEFSKGHSVEIELAPFNNISQANRLQIDGLFSIGPSFGVDGNLIVSSSTFFRLFNDRDPTEIDIGLIKLEAGADLEAVKAALVAELRSEVEIYTLKEFVQNEKTYWDVRTPAGFSFRVMVVMGFIVGVGVVYQILYSNISSCLVEYATLKAMGHTVKYLFTIVFQQSLLLAILGFIPGALIALGVYSITRNATQLPVYMTIHQFLFVLASVVTMCSLSGMVAVGKLRGADPANIF